MDDEQDHDMDEVELSNDVQHDGSQTPLSALSKEIASFPLPLQESLARRGVTSLLPIQSATFRHILEGDDAVIHAPTGSGKTLAFVLPLVARMMTSKLMAPFAKGKHSAERYVAVSPRIVTLVPSRELAKQVGKEWAKYSSAPVATVFGGVPIERHMSLIRKGGGAHVIVSTPGRLRELVREGYVDYKHIHVLVLDEADAMLDEADSPDVRSIMKDITKAVGDRETYEEMQYQLLLVSATVNDYVRKFAMEVMEISLKSKSFISVDGQYSRIASPDGGSISQPLGSAAPTVKHWYTSAKSSVRPSVAADLISTLAPRLTIIFMNTKLETETVGSYLSNQLAGSAMDVRVLHGDMAQAQRSRTISLLREGSNEDFGGRQVLVATDVASRGLDLRNVDLVIQFGIPRTAGKEGTYNVELYTHRTGRAGRAGRNTKLAAANSIMLYDPAEGEGKLVNELIQDVQKALGIEVRAKAAPTSSDIVEAGYARVANQCFDGSVNRDSALVSFFHSKLASDQRVDTSDPQQLLHHLATVMAALSNLDHSISPSEQRASLLSGDVRDRTLRVVREDGIAVSPPEVTKFCKTFGSGKLGRVTIYSDGSAVFDLTATRAEKLLEAVESRRDDAHGWHVEMPSSLPTLN